VSQALVSKVERGVIDTSVDLLERLFGALELQPRIGVERAGAHLESEIERITLTHPEQEASRVAFHLRHLSQLGVVFEGPVAAALHGVPIPIDAVDIVIQPAALDAFTEWLRTWGARRWSERWHDFGDGPVDPRQPGPLYWHFEHGDVRARICRQPPASISIVHDGITVKVRVLAELELADPLLATVLRRCRERVAAGLEPVEPQPAVPPIRLPASMLPSWARRSAQSP
jgi:hypothetical protein